MIKIITVFLLSFLCLSSFAQVNSDTSKGAKIVFEKYHHDFGDIVQGDSVFFIFKFTNTGADTLSISFARANCGCTPVILDTDKKYGPGQSGELEVWFKSAGKSGINNRAVSVFSNAVNGQPDAKIFIRVNVIPPKDASSTSKSSSKKK